jgi:hypothetical protein
MLLLTEPFSRNFSRARAIVQQLCRLPSDLGVEQPGPEAFPASLTHLAKTATSAGVSAEWLRFRMAKVC